MLDTARDAPTRARVDGRAVAAMLLLPLLTTAWALSVGPHRHRVSTTNIIPRTRRQ